MWAKKRVPVKSKDTGLSLSYSKIKFVKMAIMEVVWKKCCPDGTYGAGADGVSEPLEVEVAAIVGVSWLRRTRSSLPRHTMIKSPENTIF